MMLAYSWKLRQLLSDWIKGFQRSYTCHTALSTIRVEKDFHSVRTKWIVLIANSILCRHCSKLGFLNLGTIDILGWIIFCCGVSVRCLARYWAAFLTSVHSRPLPPSPPQLCKTKMSLDTATCPLGSKLTLVVLGNVEREREIQELSWLPTVCVAGTPSQSSVTLWTSGEGGTWSLLSSSQTNSCGQKKRTWKCSVLSGGISSMGPWQFWI